MLEAMDKKQVSTVLELCRKSFTALKGSTGKKLDAHLEKFTARYQYCTAISKGSRVLTSKYSQEVAEWIEFLVNLPFCEHGKSFWYDQLAMIYTKYQKDYDKVSLLCCFRTIVVQP